VAGFRPFGGLFGAGGGAHGAVVGEDIKMVLPIASGETVQIGDVAEIRDGKIFRAKEVIGTTLGSSDIGFETIDNIFYRQAMHVIDDQRALLVHCRYYSTQSKYFLEAVVLTDNGTSVSAGESQQIADEGNWGVQNIDIIELDTNKFLLTYKHGGDSKFKGTVVTVSGNTVTHENTFDISPVTVSTDYHSACRLAKDKVLASYDNYVRVITFNGVSATLHPEYNLNLYNPQDSYRYLERKVVAVDESHAVMYCQASKIGSTKEPFYAKPIKINSDNTCVTGSQTSSAGYVIISYPFRDFRHGNNAIAFDGNKTAIIAASSDTNVNQNMYLFINELSSDGLVISTKLALPFNSSGAYAGGLFYLGKDTDGSFYFITHYLAGGTTLLRLVRVSKDFSLISIEFNYPGVHRATPQSIISCFLNRSRIMTVLYTNAKKIFASLHDAQLAVPDGIITQAVQGGANAEIQIAGVVRNLSNLHAGATYYGGKDGKLTTIPVRMYAMQSATLELNKLGVALSTTEILMPQPIRR
jgi:hypothetical protein